MAKEIRIIGAKKPNVLTLKRVAAYARVSTDAERLMHSLSAQVSYYSELIQKTPGWKYAGVYADEGITGTKLKARTEFQRMIADCEAGKIDIILTKSISRFARNTVDLLQTVRRLKELGISVRFEKERIDTLTEDGELMLTLLASFAQEEVQSISSNMRWAVINRFQNGLAYNHFNIYGYRRKGDQLVVEPVEAQVVRRIYQGFIDHRSYEEIISELKNEGIPSHRNRTWARSAVLRILTNITYTGNLLLMKYYVTDPISKRRILNKGEREQYFVENSHEAIIDMDTFQYVQEEMQRRRQLGFKDNRALKLSCFSGIIKCESCGKSYHRTSRKNGARHSSMYGDHYNIWRCASRANNSKVCHMNAIPEKVLLETSAKVLGTAEFDEETFTARVDHITVPKDGELHYFFKDGTDKLVNWERISSGEYLKLYNTQHKMKKETTIIHQEGD